MTNGHFSACLLPMHWTSPLTLLVGLLLTAGSVCAEDKKDEAKLEQKEPVSRDGSVTIAGAQIDYTVTTGELNLKNDKGEAQASIFHVSYIKKDVKDVGTRPVLFAFNGGPGSSAVWLHLGALGPKIIPTSADGTKALKPPVTVVGNPQSILDVADLVFVDPVATGLSRPEDKNKSKQFFGVNGDLDSMSDFIRRWVTQHKRWSTRLDPQWIIANHLRISPTKFRKQLLNSEGNVLGRFDARVAWDAIDSSSDYPDYDPSYSVVHGPISTAMLDYLGRDLGWKDERVYEILTGKVHPWNWNANNSYVNLSGSIASALKHNPKLRVLVQCGHTDLATPANGILYSINHLMLPKAQRANIKTVWYDAGHMFYLNQTDLEKMRKDLVSFITEE